MQVSFASAALFNRKPAAPQGGGEAKQPKQQPVLVATPAGDTFVRFSGCCG